MRTQTTPIKNETEREKQDLIGDNSDGKMIFVDTKMRGCELRRWSSFHDKIEGRPSLMKV